MQRDSHVVAIDGNRKRRFLLMLSSCREVTAIVLGQRNCQSMVYSDNSISSAIWSKLLLSLH